MHETIMLDGRGLVGGGAPSLLLAPFESHRPSAGRPMGGFMNMHEENPEDDLNRALYAPPRVGGAPRAKLARPPGESYMGGGS